MSTPSDVRGGAAVDLASSAPAVELPSADALARVAAVERPVETGPVRFRPLVSVLAAFGLALVGALVWAIITVVTDYQLGIIAIVVGLLAGVGAARGGRTPQAQVVGASAAAVGFFAGQLLTVLIVLFQQVAAPAGAPGLLGVLPVILVEIVKQTFTSMDLVFLGIAVWEGYRLPRPR